MSGGRMLSKLLLFLASLLMVFLYVFFYFFPTVKNINQLKRSDHDMRLQKTDLSRRLVFFRP